LLIPGGFLLFLLPSVAQASQEDFWSMELILTASSLYCHLGSPLDPAFKAQLRDGRLAQVVECSLASVRSCIKTPVMHSWLLGILQPYTCSWGQCHTEKGAELPDTALLPAQWCNNGGVRIDKSLFHRDF
jgi:hypothetical protein